MPGPPDPPPPLPVTLEVGTKRAFAAAVDWPGWCRAGKTEQAALDALAASAPRYAAVAAGAGLEFHVDRTPAFAVVERVPGDATTDYGAPGKVVEADRVPLSIDEAERMARLVAAAWTTFDSVIASAPSALRKGPRGGGRDRDAIAAHVVAAENAYARVIGLRIPEPSATDRPAVEAQRAALLDAIRQASDGTPLGGKRWPPRTAARRIAWHVLDHAWEIEDRSEPGPG